MYLLVRMTTCRLYIDPDQVAEADKDDFAKYGFNSVRSPARLITICLQSICWDREPLFRQRRMSIYTRFGVCIDL